MIKQMPLSMRQVLAPKAGLTQQIAAEAHAQPGGFSVYFSSVSSIAGANIPGQQDVVIMDGSL